ncbi:MAG: nucleoside diphosphate kinase regulator [Acidobacteriia bacterium]|nr:nucleoside diphosphate kinase regulator [Terriglobia bacterium]
MKGHSIVVTDADMDRLSRLVRALKHSLFRDQQQLEWLDQTLESADVRPPGSIPRDVIRMNSSIRVLDFDTDQKELYTLVFPENADISRGQISVLAPVGIALLGRRQGDVIEIQAPGRTRRLRVEHVLYRPEIEGKRVQPDRSRRREVPLHRRSQKTSLAA